MILDDLRMANITDESAIDHPTTMSSMVYAGPRIAPIPQATVRGHQEMEQERRDRLRDSQPSQQTHDPSSSGLGPKLDVRLSPTVPSLAQWPVAAMRGLPPPPCATSP